MTRTVFIDRFSGGLDDLTRKQQAEPAAVLRVLQKTKRFSVFEATDNDVISRTVSRICQKGCEVVKPDGLRKKYGKLLEMVGGNYPWTHVELTDGGIEYLKDNPV